MASTWPVPGGPIRRPVSLESFASRVTLCRVLHGGFRLGADLGRFAVGLPQWIFHHRPRRARRRLGKLLVAAAPGAARKQHDDERTAEATIQFSPPHIKSTNWSAASSQPPD